MTQSAEPETPTALPLEPLEFEGIELAPRSPVRAAAYSAAGIGWGQIYNKQLEKAVLLWIWSAILAGMGLGLMILGTLGNLVPRQWPRPPLGDVVADHPGWFLLAWLCAMFSLWLVNVRDAHLSAGRINRKETLIRYPMRRQMVHVLGSQLLGLIPVVGILFPPAVVAEAIDMSQTRRGPDKTRLIREGGQAVLEWAATKIAIYLLWGATAVWVIWWLARILTRLF